MILALDQATGLVGIFGVITTALLGAMSWRATRANNESQATKAITDANVSLLGVMQTQLAAALTAVTAETASRRQLEIEVRRLSHQLDDEQDYVERLTRWLTDHGVPVPTREGRDAK